MNLEEIVKKYDRMAKIIAKIYSMKLYNSGIDFNDLYQVAMLGIIENYYKYDEEKSSLNTFIYEQMVYAVLKYISSNSYKVHIPNDITALINIEMKLVREYYKQYNEEISDEELLNKLKNNKLFLSKFKSKLNIEKIRKLKEYNKKFYNFNVYSLENDVEVYVDDIENYVVNKATLNELLECLTEKEKYILLSIYGIIFLEKIQLQLAEEFNCSKKNISRIYCKSLRKLKENIDK